MKFGSVKVNQDAPSWQSPEEKGEYEARQRKWERQELRKRIIVAYVQSGNLRSAVEIDEFATELARLAIPD